MSAVSCNFRLLSCTCSCIVPCTFSPMGFRSAQPPSQPARMVFARPGRFPLRRPPPPRSASRAAALALRELHSAQIRGARPRGLALSLFAVAMPGRA
eukprot:4836103-Prymnesium_polylepis.1